MNSPNKVKNLNQAGVTVSHIKEVNLRFIPGKFTRKVLSNVNSGSKVETFLMLIC